MNTNPNIHGCATTLFAHPQLPCMLHVPHMPRVSKRNQRLEACYTKEYADGELLCRGAANYTMEVLIGMIEHNKHKPFVCMPRPTTPQTQQLDHTAPTCMCDKPKYVALCVLGTHTPATLMPSRFRRRPGPNNNE